MTEHGNRAGVGGEGDHKTTNRPPLYKSYKPTCLKAASSPFQLGGFATSYNSRAITVSAAVRPALFFFSRCCYCYGGALYLAGRHLSRRDSLRFQGSFYEYAPRVLAIMVDYESSAYALPPSLLMECC